MSSTVLRFLSIISFNLHNDPVSGRGRGTVLIPPFSTRNADIRVPGLAQVTSPVSCRARMWPGNLTHRLFSESFNWAELEKGDGAGKIAGLYAGQGTDPESWGSGHLEGEKSWQRLGFGRETLGRWEGIHERLESLPHTLGGIGNRERKYGKGMEREGLNNFAVHYSHNSFSAFPRDAVMTKLLSK